MEKVYDVVIVGAGPAGLTAAIYALRAGLDTLLLEKSFTSGGQTASTYEIDNYPGLPGISGEEFGQKIRSAGTCVREGTGEGDFCGREWD